MPSTGGCGNPGVTLLSLCFRFIHVGLPLLFGTLILSLLPRRTGWGAEKEARPQEREEDREGVVG